MDAVTMVNAIIKNPQKTKDRRFRLSLSSKVSA
jgi:hypothetical protein